MKDEGRGINSDIVKYFQMGLSKLVLLKKMTLELISVRQKYFESKKKMNK